MAFALGGEAETRDPVSGNNVPPGSLPVEVRDDIPARLSEGEYVVPADVVRFFGVKFFEDIRMEAKKGLQQMDVDGRIGGEPIPPQMQMAQAPEQDIDAMIDAEMGNMNAGGLMSGYAEGAAVTTPSYTPGGGVGYGYGMQPMSAPQTVAPPAPVAPVITATAEPVARQEPVGGCPEGTLWNGYLCAVNLSYNPNAGDLPDDPETTPVEKWYEEDGGKALVNPEEYITEQFNKGTGTSGINSLIPKGPGAQLAFGIFDLVNKKSSISKAAAAYRVAEAAGLVEPDSPLQEIGNRLFGKGEHQGKALVGEYSDGDWKVNNYAKSLGFTDWEDTQKDEQSKVLFRSAVRSVKNYEDSENALGKIKSRRMTLAQKRKSYLRPGETGAGPVIITGDAEVEAYFAANRAARKDGTRDSGKSDADVAAEKAASRAIFEKQFKKDPSSAGSFSNVSTGGVSKRDPSRPASDTRQGRQDYNKGGLATKPKNKTKAYKKGGLASKKK